MYWPGIPAAPPYEPAIPPPPAAGIHQPPDSHPRVIGRASAAIVPTALFIDVPPATAA